MAPLPKRGRVKVPTPQYRSITRKGRPVCNLSVRAAVDRRTACINAVSASLLACKKHPGDGYRLWPPTALSSCRTAGAFSASSSGISASGWRTHRRQTGRLSSPADKAVSTLSASVSSGSSRISAPPLSRLIAICPLCPAGKWGAAQS